MSGVRRFSLEGRLTASSIRSHFTPTGTVRAAWAPCSSGQVEVAAAQPSLRTVDALWRALGQLVDQLEPDECATVIRHSGYLQSP